MEYRILGPLEVVDDGRAIKVAGAKQRALLAVLLSHANEVVSRDRLIDELWGEQPPDTAPAALQVHVSQLRKALERRAGPDGNPETQLITRSPGYMLRVGDGDLDLHRFERLLRDGRSALRSDRPHAAAELLREALGLWRGPPLAELAASPFATAERSRLEELRLAALEERIDADLRLGEHAALIPELEALVHEHPLREGVRGQLMLALYRAGRQSEALDAYREGRRLLTEELGLDPGEELRRLERSILEHDSAIAAPTAPLAVRLADAAAHRSRLLVIVGALIVAGAASGLAVALMSGGEKRNVTVAPNSVAVVNGTSGRVVADVPVGGSPVGIAAGEAATWVTNADDATLLRIDQKTHHVTDTIGLGGDINAVCVGFGSVWVAGGNDETLIRVDPRRKAVQATLHLGRANPLNPRPAFFVACGRRLVWVTRGDTLLGVDPRTNAVVSDIATGAAYDLTAGGGDVWVTTQSERLLRIDEASGSTTAATELPAGAYSPTFVPGALWLIVGTPRPQVLRIDPSSLTQSGALSFPSGFPVALAANGRDIWVADHASGVALRIDRSTVALTGRTRLGWHPISMIANAGFVWVGVRERPF